jgi:hypothetical protein
MKVLELHSPLAAKLLARPELVRLLKPFMGQPISIKQAAVLMGLEVERLYYRVQQFVEAGMIKVVSEQPRRGRAVKLYHATAKAFRVPAGVVPPALMESLEWADAWREEFYQAIRRTQHYGQWLLVFLNPDGTLTWSGFYDPNQRPQNPAVLSEDFPAVLNQWTASLFLEPAEAKELQRELWSLFGRYHGRGGPKRYGMHVGLAPLERPVDE